MIDTDKMRELWRHVELSALLEMAQGDIFDLCDELDRTRADRDSWRRVAERIEREKQEATTGGPSDENLTTAIKYAVEERDEARRNATAWEQRAEQAERERDEALGREKRLRAELSDAKKEVTDEESKLLESLSRERRLRAVLEALCHRHESYSADPNIGGTDIHELYEAARNVLADEPEPSASGGWPTAPIRDKPWYSVYQPEPSGDELGPAPGSVEHAWSEPVSPTEEREIDEAVLGRSANPFRTHTGTEPPPDLAPAQMLQVSCVALPEFGRFDRIKVMTVAKVSWDVVDHYRPLLSDDGLPYVSGEGLEPWAKYVATDYEGLPFQLPFQFAKKPHLPQDRLFWREPNAAMKEAPATHRIPGDWRQSLARVWRMEG